MPTSGPTRSLREAVRNRLNPLPGPSPKQTKQILRPRRRALELQVLGDVLQVGTHQAFGLVGISGGQGADDGGVFVVAAVGKAGVAVHADDD